MTTNTQFIATLQYYEDYGTRWKPKGGISLAVPEQIARAGTRSQIVDYLIADGWVRENFGDLFSVSAIVHTGEFNPSDLFAVELMGSLEKALADERLADDYATIKNIVSITSLM